MWAPPSPPPAPVVLWPSLLPAELPDLSAPFLLSQGSRAPFAPSGLKVTSCCCLPFRIPYRFCNLTQRSFSNSPLKSPKISAEHGFSGSEQGADGAPGAPVTEPHTPVQVPVRFAPRVCQRRHCQGLLRHTALRSFCLHQHCFCPVCRHGENVFLKVFGGLR